MLAYYISGSNAFTIRVGQVTPISGSYNFGSMQLQNMMTLENSTASLTGVTYNAYESMLSFTASISDTVVGAQYRAQLGDAGDINSLWNGSFSVFTSQSIDKPNYTNQIPLEDVFKSRLSTNEYIILE
jgi:hypothetical protein